MSVSTPRFLNVAAHLSEAAAHRPDDIAVAWPAGRRGGRATYQHLTCRQLNEESARLARGLRMLGIRRGMRTVLMVPPSRDFFALTFALFKIGAVIVFIDPGMGVRNLGRCLDEAEPEAFIGVGKAHLARLIFRWGRRSVRITVGPGGRHSFAKVRRLGVVGNDECADVTADEIAAILFTSGSTGIAKGAVYAHGTFAHQVEALRSLFRIERGEVDLTTFPLFALFAPALGMTAIVPDMNPTRPAQADPRKLIEAIEDWRVTNLFGSPALLNVLSRYGVERGIKLPTVRRVISAGAPVPAAVIERMTKLLEPEARVYTPYGATECLPVACIDDREILGETRAATEQGRGVCVGRPVPEIALAIIPVSDDSIPAWNDGMRLPAGEIGEIVVRGPFTTRAYFGRPEADSLAKIPDGDSVWHRMGDVGYLDARGRVWFCGRKSHRVATPTGVLFSVPVEGVFDAHPEVFRSALVGTGHEKRQEPVLCVELEPASASRRTSPKDRARLRQELLAIGANFPHTAGIRRILFHPAFPVDIRHNAKIFREKLAIWAEKQRD